MVIGTAEWVFLAMALLTVLGFLFWSSNLVSVVRKTEMRCEVDHRLNTAYQAWRERVSASGGVRPVPCPRAFDWGETCFAHESVAFLYEPMQPHGSDKPERPIFDTACGESVAEGWSILDCFEGTRFVGRGSLFVTNRNLYFRDAVRDIRISLDDVRMVATACSSFLVETASSDRPLIFTGVNGQKLRDTICMLLEAA